MKNKIKRLSKNTKKNKMIKKYGYITKITLEIIYYRETL